MEQKATLSGASKIAVERSIPRAMAQMRSKTATACAGALLLGEEIPKIRSHLRLKLLA
jgi:hypothetical protein